MNRHSEIITAGPVTIETYVDGGDKKPEVVVLPSYGRDGGGDSTRSAPRSRRPATAYCGPSHAAPPAPRAR